MSFQFEEDIEVIREEVIALRRELKEIREHLLKQVVEMGFARRNDF